MARPKKSEEEKKAMRLPHVRVKSSERAHVDAQAANAGMTTSEYIYTLAMTTEVKPRPTKLNASFLVELNRIGVNLNQIAHARNSGRDDPAILQYAIDELVLLMQKIGRSV